MKDLEKMSENGYNIEQKPQIIKQKIFKIWLHKIIVWSHVWSVVWLVVTSLTFLFYYLCLFFLTNLAESYQFSLCFQRTSSYVHWFLCCFFICFIYFHSNLYYLVLLLTLGFVLKVPEVILSSVFLSWPLC